MIPPRLWPYIGAAIVAAALLAAIGVQTVRLSAAEAETAQVRQDWADERADMQAELTAANQRERSIENQRQDDARKATDEAEKLRTKAAAAGAAAASMGRKLRDAQSAAIASLRACKGSGAASAGAPADTTERVLADMQRRLDEATDGIARFADESRGAGLTCERIYDSLISSK